MEQGSSSDKETTSLRWPSHRPTSLPDAPASHPAFPGSQAPDSLGQLSTPELTGKSTLESPGTPPWNVLSLEHTTQSPFPTRGLEHKDPPMTWTRRCRCGQRATWAECRAAVTPEGKLRLLRIPSWSWWVCDLLALSRRAHLRPSRGSWKGQSACLWCNDFPGKLIFRWSSVVTAATSAPASEAGWGAPRGPPRPTSPCVRQPLLVHRLLFRLLFT